MLAKLPGCPVVKLNFLLVGIYRRLPRRRLADGTSLRPQTHKSCRRPIRLRCTRRSAAKMAGREREIHRFRQTISRPRQRISHPTIHVNRTHRFSYLPSRHHQRLAEEHLAFRHNMPLGTRELSLTPVDLIRPGRNLLSVQRRFRRARFCRANRSLAVNWDFLQTLPTSKHSWKKREPAVSWLASA